MNYCAYTSQQMAVTKIVSPGALITPGAIEGVFEKKKAVRVLFALNIGSMSISIRKRSYRY